MSSYVLPAWALHAASAARGVDHGESGARRRLGREAFAERTGIARGSIRRLEGLGVLLAVLAATAFASALPALSPASPLAARTAAAEQSLAVARASGSGPEVAPVWQPQLDRMLPFLPLRPAE